MNTLDKETIYSLLERAGESAQKAGHALMANKAEWSVVNSNVSRDIKLQADCEAEAIIIAHLQQEHHYPILAEESGWHDHGTSAPEIFWVIDPLDGTANFFSEIPFCGPAIALIQHGKPILGAIFDINHNELFLGATQIGATLNGEPIHVRKTSEKSQATLMTGFPVNRDFSDEGMIRFAREAAKWKKVRMMGSAALSLAYVAAGRADAYHEESIMMWDVAAGLAIVEAAGGCVEFNKTAFDKPLDVSAGNKLVSVDLKDR